MSDNVKSLNNASLSTENKDFSAPAAKLTKMKSNLFSNKTKESFQGMNPQLQFESILYDDQQMRKRYQIFYQQNDQLCEIVIELNEGTSIRQLIECAQQYFQDNSSLKEISEFDVYIAKKNGQPKMDYPSFAHDQSIKKTGTTMFSLVHNLNASTIISPYPSKEVLNVSFVTSEKKIRQSKIGYENLFVEPEIKKGRSIFQNIIDFFGCTNAE